jgi:uncharacterized protein YebE (UPF0316 family)
MIELLQAHTWALLLAVFLSRIADQTLDTFRTISIFRGYRFLAALMGFFTVLIWINVAGQVISNIHTNWYLTVVYAAGFAAGQATGLWVESRIALGHQLVRVWSRSEPSIAEQLWQRNYAMTEIEGKSKAGPIDVVFVVVRRNRVKVLCELINELDPKAFYTVEDVKQVGLRQSDPGLLLGRKIWQGMGDLVTFPVETTKKMWKKKG